MTALSRRFGSGIVGLTRVSVPCRGGCGQHVARYTSLDWAFCAACTRRARNVARQERLAAGIAPGSPAWQTASNAFERRPENYLRALARA